MKNLTTYNGIFLIHTSKQGNIFIFYDAIKDTIAKYKLYSGSSVYTEYNKFILEILEDGIKRGVNYSEIWTHNNYTSKTTEFICRNKLNVSIFTYKNFDMEKPLAIDMIRHFLKRYDIFNLTENTLDAIIQEFSMGNKSNKYKGLINISRFSREHNLFSSNTLDGIKSTRRNYSTQTKGLHSVDNSKITEYRIVTHKYGWRSWISPAVNLNMKKMITNNLNSFWNKVVIKALKSNRKLKVTLQMRIQLTNGQIRNISDMDTVGLKDLNMVVEGYINTWVRRYENNYSMDQIKSIIILHKIHPENYNNKFRNIISKSEMRKYSKNSVMDLIPKNMDFKTWGEVKYNPITDVYNVAIEGTKLIATIISNDMENIVQICTRGVSVTQNLELIRDRLPQPDHKYLYDFVRHSASLSIYLKNSTVWSTSRVLPVEFIKRRRKGKITPIHKVITMDIETKEIYDQETKSWVMAPVLISICTGRDKFGNYILKSFGIWDYKTSDDLVKETFWWIMRSKYRDYSVYIHNLSKFDSLFIMRPLISMYPSIYIDTIRRDSSIIKMRIEFGLRENVGREYHNYHITLYDSFLLLPQSLDKLGSAFKSEYKDIFPLKILNDSKITWDYAGEYPAIDYFYVPPVLKFYKKYMEFMSRYNSARDHYIENNIKWVLKNELIKYCEQDVKTLYNVIINFDKLIFDTFNVSISSSPTLPSVAFNIFKSNFMKEDNIPIITGSAYLDHKNAYYGGIVDVYRPYGRSIKSYDVNSLYPYIMSKCPMPIGSPTYFTGDGSIIQDLFGFVYVNVECPKDLKTPFLPHRLKVNSSISTIYPTGSWSGWYFTEELKNAAKYGYKYEILKGYHYSSDVIFRKYVEAIYKIKVNSEPGSAMYMISKLLLNSLYGRFGMDPDLITSRVIRLEDLSKFQNNVDLIIVDAEIFGDYCWVSYLENTTDSCSAPDVSIPIAAAITAYSRIEMSEYIMNNSDNIYAIDTDGIKIGSELEPKYIGSELGKMKDEGTFIEAAFIAPKVYGGIQTNGDMVSKAKGLKSGISYWLLKSLLYKDKIQIPQSKWYRNFSEATIRILSELYTVSPTDNKRKLIRDSSGILVGTRPYSLNDGVLIRDEIYVLHYLPSPVSWLLFAPEEYPMLSLPETYLMLPSPVYNAYPMISGPSLYDYPLLISPESYPMISAPEYYPMLVSSPNHKVYPLLPSPEVYIMLPAPQHLPCLPK